MSATQTLPSRVASTVLPILGAISLAHLLNDVIQSLLPALYPLLKSRYGLSFVQIGLITLAFQLTASLLQPVFGMVTDRRPMPFALAAGMGVSLCGLLLLSVAGQYAMLLTAAAMVGFGSAVFHPDSARIARLASGGRYGLAQSIFSVGGNAGQSLGPLLAAFIVVPHGQHAIAWFALAAFAAMLLLRSVGRWYRDHLASLPRRRAAAVPGPLSPVRTRMALAVLLVLVFSKFVYLSSINTYLTFYLIDCFHLPVQSAQLHLFLFLASVALGTLVGGPIGDRIGRKYVIWVSILGVLPFTLALPYAGLTATAILLMVIGLVLSSAFSAMVVYAQDLMPGRIGLVSGLFFGLAFGMGGLGAAGLGLVADHAGLRLVYHLCSVLPALGLFAALLPSLREPPRQPVPVSR